MKTSVGILKQVVLTMAASLGYLTIGLIRGWSSTAMPSMEKLDSYLIPNDDAESWICAIPPLGAFIGSLTAGPLLQRFGRKKTLLLSGPIFIFGWILLGAARKLQLLITARAITGFCAGLVTPSAQVYVSECAYPEIRGLLGSLPALFMAIGVLVSYILGTWLQWNYLAYASSFFPAAMLVLLIPLPESPNWLSDNNRHKEADLALEWLDRKERKPIGETEIFTVLPSPLDEKTATSTAISASNKQEHSIKTAKVVLKGRYSREALTQKSVLIPFGLVVGILVFQQISGIDTVIFYTVSIFNASGSSVSEYKATITVGLVQVVATFISTFLTDRTGRKPLLLLSGVLMGISMGLLGVYFYVTENYPEKASDIGLIPIISLIVFMSGFSIGYCNIPFLLMGELLPLAQRSLLSSVAGAMNLGSMFLVIKTYPNIKELVGAKGVFGLYSFFCFLSCIFVLVFLPETKKKSLEEIEEYFEMSNKKKVSST
ncbi:facilitated trehalose transporter Tret1-like isoform X2 [Lycorma delicatula]|uniref:facilitated trehalose transporter Tret1-like isoform X2 n=1 Tax=Lycorma delicatula TaxID=130591 RepID=UPI003F51492F